MRQIHTIVEYTWISVKTFSKLTNLRLKSRIKEYSSEEGSYPRRIKGLSSSSSNLIKIGQGIELGN